MLRLADIMTRNVAGEGLPSSSYFTQLWSDASDAVSDRFENPDGGKLDLLDEHSVDEIMSRPLVMLAPADDVLRAATIMEAKSIHRSSSSSRERSSASSARSTSFARSRRARSIRGSSPGSW